MLNANLNVSTNKCNLNSPAPNTNSSTHSLYDASSILCNGGVYSSSSAYSSYKMESNTSLSDSPPSLNNTGNHSHCQNPNDLEIKRKCMDLQSNKRRKEAENQHDDEDGADFDDGDDAEMATSDEDDVDDNDDGFTNDQSEIFNSNTSEANVKMENSFLRLTTNSDQNEKNIKKAKVVELYTQGERCVRKLSQITGVPLTTVYRVIGKLKGINYNIPRGNGAGRKTILDAKDREILVNILNNHPRISRKALGKELEKSTGKSIHSSTLNRELCRLRHHGKHI
jgi:transposase